MPFHLWTTGRLNPYLSHPRPCSLNIRQRIIRTNKSFLCWYYAYYPMRFVFLSTPLTHSILVELTLCFSGLTVPCARRASWRAWAMPHLLTVGTLHPASAADSSPASYACGFDATCLASLAFSSCDTICVQREYKCKGRTKHSVHPGGLGSEFFNWVSAHINNNVHIYLYIIQFHIIYIYISPLWFTSTSS